MAIPWKHLPILAFDTETTGFNRFTGDRIIEFAAVVLQLGPDGRVASQEAHSWLINPGIPIPRQASEVSGITDRDVAQSPRFEDVASEIHALLANAITVAHNYTFDMEFLTQEFLRAKMDWPEPLAEVDTLDVSFRVFPNERSHNLGALSERLSISLEHAHRATDDAGACGRCFVEMARRNDVVDDLQGMLDWANAIGRPPRDGPLVADARGHVIFTGGPHAGQPVSRHPIHLAWIEKARVRHADGWGWRYPEDARRWARRWLDVRGSGRARQQPKSFRAEDWVLDPCIAVEPQVLG